MAAPAAAAAAAAADNGGIHAQLPELLRAIKSAHAAKGLLQAYALHFADEAAFDAAKPDVYAIIAVAEGVQHPQLLLNSLHPNGKTLAASVAALLAAYGLADVDAESKSPAYKAACRSDFTAKVAVQSRWKRLRDKVVRAIEARAVGAAGGGAAVAAGVGDDDGIDAGAEADGAAAQASGAQAALARKSLAGARGRKRILRAQHDKDDNEGQERFPPAEEEQSAASGASAAPDSSSAPPRRPLAFAVAVASLLTCREHLAALLAEPEVVASASASASSGAATVASPSSAASSSSSATAASTSSSSASVSLPSGAAPAWLARPRGREWARRLLDVLTEVPDDVSADFVSDGAVGSKRPRSRQSRISSAFVLTMPALVRVPFIATHLTQLLSYAPYTRAQEAAFPRDTYLPRAGDYVIPLENGMEVGRFTPTAASCAAPTPPVALPSTVSRRVISVRVAEDDSVWVTRILGSSVVYLLPIASVWPGGASASSALLDASASVSASASASSAAPVTGLPSCTKLQTLAIGTETQLRNGDTLLFHVSPPRAGAEADAPALPDKLAQFVLRSPDGFSAAGAAAGAGAGAVGHDDGLQDDDGEMRDDNGELQGDNGELQDDNGELQDEDSGRAAASGDDLPASLGSSSRSART